MKSTGIEPVPFVTAIARIKLKKKSEIGIEVTSRGRQSRFFYFICVKYYESITLTHFVILLLFSESFEEQKLYGAGSDDRWCYRSLFDVCDSSGTVPMPIRLH